MLSTFMPKYAMRGSKSREFHWVRRRRRRRRRRCRRWLYIVYDLYRYATILLRTPLTFVLFHSLVSEVSTHTATSNGREFEWSSRHIYKKCGSIKAVTTAWTNGEQYKWNERGVTAMAKKERRKGNITGEWFYRCWFSPYRSIFFLCAHWNRNALWTVTLKRGLNFSKLESRHRIFKLKEKLFRQEIEFIQSFW